MSAPWTKLYIYPLWRSAVLRSTSFSFYNSLFKISTCLKLLYMDLGMTLDHPAICPWDVNVSRVSPHGLGGSAGPGGIIWNFCDDRFEILSAWALRHNESSIRICYFVGPGRATRTITTTAWGSCRRVISFPVSILWSPPYIAWWAQVLEGSWSWRFMVGMLLKTAWKFVGWKHRMESLSRGNSLNERGTAKHDPKGTYQHWQVVAPCHHFSHFLAVHIHWE